MIQCTHCITLCAHTVCLPVGSGCTFNLVSQKSINYTCVVKVQHTPNTCAYVVRCCIYTYAQAPNPTPTTPTHFNIAQELIFQHAACTSKVHTKCPTVLYASSFFSHTHWPYITLAVYILLQVVATLLLVICAKYEIHKTFNQQLQPGMFSRCYSCGTIRAVTLS